MYFCIPLSELLQPTLCHVGRIVLDEAHLIRNRRTEVSRGCCSLTGTHRWAVTGTPIVNSAEDVFALFKFLWYRQVGVSAHTPAQDVLMSRCNPTLELVHMISGSKTCCGRSHCAITWHCLFAS